MSPSADEVPTQRLGIKKASNTRPTVVPAIPLPFVEKQRQQKQRKRLQQEQGDLLGQHQKQAEPALRVPKPESSVSVPVAQPAPFVLPADRGDASNITASSESLLTATTRTSKDTGGGVPNGRSISRPSTSHDYRDFDIVHPHDVVVNATSHLDGLPAKQNIKLQKPTDHQASLNNGSIYFGTSHGSEDTLPPPPHDAHIGVPPPGMIGLHPSVYMPYNIPSPGMGGWHGPSRMAPSSDVNGYTSTASFNTSTPRSFHGSQSPDNVNITSGTHGSHVSNNGPFPPPDLPLHNDTRPTILSPPPSSLHSNGFPGIGLAKGDIYPTEGAHHLGLEFVHFLEQQLHQSFHDARSADCYLMLHFPSKVDIKGGLNRSTGRDASSKSGALMGGPPLLFMGHRAALTQSHTISQMLHSGNGVTVQTGSFGYPVLVLHVTLGDPYITADASFQALRSLYGLANNDVNVTTAHSRVQAMDMAISNLVAGFLFMLNNVEMVGVEQACQLLGWDTIERVLAFCLNGSVLPNTPTVDHDMFGIPYPQAEFRYARGAGQNIRRLLHKALDFIIWNFPDGFVMQESSELADTSPVPLSRFPCTSPKEVPVEGHHASCMPFKRDANHDYQLRNDQDTSKTFSSGSVSLPSRTVDLRSKRSPQSETIVFGDFSPAQGKKTMSTCLPLVTPNGTHKPGSIPPSQANSTAAILSRVLSGIPFGFVNFILEHPNLGWGSSNSSLPLALDTRRAIARDLVVERESRRQRTVHEIREHTSVDLDGILPRICSPSPPHHQDYTMDGWDALGWKEACHNEGPGLVRILQQSQPVAL
ncbi:hypothetical protein CMQ_2307 [Grosmannia clavigera kw1407]|uniref:Uncharacterized protein n=1 Tax=Grosmannia clavigera (strain kw1407 / UAMH 11150) TaxID=655863 RepID=F0XJA4_GROCL|nr:uncharacterized protein CMQ_2307 [Grosmannia clavigera kw1407]EFX02258.1 hypothetical protein CMQ_2307 [Grosmannia clavigera kw1407]